MSAGCPTLLGGAAAQHCQAPRVGTCAALGGARMRGRRTRRTWGVVDSAQLPPWPCGFHVAHSCPSRSCASLVPSDPLHSFRDRRTLRAELDSWNCWSPWPWSIPQCLPGTESRPSRIYPLGRCRVCGSCQVREPPPMAQPAAPVPSAWFICDLRAQAETLGQAPDSYVPQGRNPSPMDRALPSGLGVGASSLI